MLDALADFVDRWKEQSDLDVSLLVQPPGTSLDTLPPAAELQLLRIVQEALSNVRKHAEAKHVEVRIIAADGEVETVIVDDGRGFDTIRSRSPDRTPHFGLSTMRERAESVGGKLQIVSTLGGGTRVEVRLPTRSPSSLDGASMRPSS